MSYSSVCVYWRWPPSLRRLQLVLVLVSCFIVHLSLGTIYTFGNLVPYIVSYVRVNSHPKDLRFTDAPYVYACQIGGQGMSMFLGGLLEKRFGPRLITLFGSLLMSGGVALSYLSIQYSFWLMLATYGLMFGIGIGLAYVGPIACAMRWLPKWKGLASGIVVSGFGLSALIFNGVQTGYINPYNSAPNEPDPRDSDIKYFSQEDVLNRVPSVFLILSGCYATMQILASIFLVNPPPDEFLSSDNSNTNLLNGNRDRTDSNESYEISSNGYKKAQDSRSGIIDSTSLDNQEKTKNRSKEEEEREGNRLNQSLSESDSSSNSPLFQRTVSSTSSLNSDMNRNVTTYKSNRIYSLSPFLVVTKPNFYLLWLMFFFGGTAVSYISSLYKSFGLEEITRDDHFLTITGGISAIFNLLGRLIWGAFADIATYKVALVVQGAIMTSLLVTLYSTSVTGRITFFVWICGIYFCVGGYFSLFPTAVARCFGEKNVSINYGLLFTSQIAGGILAGLISQLLVDSLHWYGMFFLIGGLAGMGYLLALFYRHKRYLRLPPPDEIFESITHNHSDADIKFPDEPTLNFPTYD